MVCAGALAFLVVMRFLSTGRFLVRVSGPCYGKPPGFVAAGNGGAPHRFAMRRSLVRPALGDHERTDVALPATSPVATSSGVVMASADDRDEIARLEEELRLLKAEHAKALDQQAAMSDVLHIIVGSPGQLKPALDALLEHALRLCEATDGGLFRVSGDSLPPGREGLGGLASTASRSTRSG